MSKEQAEVKAPALGISVRSTFPNTELVFQTHFDREEKFAKKVDEILDYVEGKQDIAKIRAQIDEIPEIEDALRKQNLMLDDFKRQSDTALENILFEIEKETVTTKILVEKARLEQQQLINTVNRKSSNKNDTRYVATEQNALDRINLDVKQLEDKLVSLEAERENPNPARPDMRNLKQINIQIDRSNTELGRLKIEIEKRVKLKDGLNKRSDN